MKVYAVVESNFAGENLIAVFSNREAANKHREDLGTYTASSKIDNPVWQRYYCEVEEYDLLDTEV